MPRDVFQGWCIGRSPRVHKLADEVRRFSDIPFEKVQAVALLDMPGASLVPLRAQMDEALELDHRQEGIETDLVGERTPCLVELLDFRVRFSNLKPDLIGVRRPRLLQGQLVQPDLNHLSQVLAYVLFVPLQRRREVRFIESAHGRVRCRRRRGSLSAQQKQRNAEMQSGPPGRRQTRSARLE